MHSLHLHTFVRWFFQFESYGPAILVTVGAALLMACGIGAACSPCKEKDEVFHRQVFCLPSAPQAFDVPRFFCPIVTAFSLRLQPPNE
jgi:hypothetical protein